MNPLYPHVAERAANRCEYCHAPEVVSNTSFEVEHITPQAHGGASDTDNTALSCRSCNNHKSAAQVELDVDTNRIVRLFHPRRDRWDDHFSYDAATGEIVGSPIGRATVTRLQMNSAFQVAARPLWVRLGIFLSATRLIRRK